MTQQNTNASHVRRMNQSAIDISAPSVWLGPIPAYANSATVQEGRLLGHLFGKLAPSITEPLAIATRRVISIIPFTCDRRPRLCWRRQPAAVVKYVDGDWSLSIWVVRETIARFNPSMEEILRHLDRYVNLITTKEGKIQEIERNK